MNSVLAVVCVIFAVVLIGLEVYATIRPKGDGDSKLQVTGLPGGTTVEALADKAPRAAAALAFMILAGVFQGLLSFEASVDDGSSGGTSSQTG